MGISANQFWAASQNGKAMLVMLCRRRDPEGNPVAEVELVRDICEWLVARHRNDVISTALQKGANKEQAKARADNVCGGLQALVESMNDRNVETVAVQVVDHIFARFYNAGQQQYLKAMAWFADEMRQRVKDDQIP